MTVNMHVNMWEGNFIIVKIFKNMTKNYFFVIGIASLAFICPQLSAQPLSKTAFLKISHLNLRKLETENRASLRYICKSGKDYPDSHIGCYAADADSYKVFASFFDDIIETYHGFTSDQIHVTDRDLSKIVIPDEIANSEKILSVRIRACRNLNGFAFGSIISSDDRSMIELLMRKTFINIDPSCSGSYLPLKNMSQEEKDLLITNHLLFDSNDKYMESAGFYKDWPNNRGIFLSKKNNFMVWLNEEDHLRIIALETGGNIKKAFETFLIALNSIEKEVDFAYDRRLGYLSSCPSNLGTGMRASILIYLPELGKNKKKLNKICHQMGLNVRGKYGENNKKCNHIFDISNAKRLGISEVEIINLLIDGISELIKLEDNLKEQIN